MTIAPLATQALPTIGSQPDGEQVDHARLKKQYLEYLGSKSEEIKEQQDARRFYHGSQYTKDQIKTFNDRKQPVVTFNRIARKINAIVGLLDKQKQDPKAFPRTPNGEKGAEVATAVLRYVTDEQRWPFKTPVCGINGAVDGIGCIELTIEQGDSPDPDDHDIGLEPVDPATFFYDPTSVKDDFSDAGFMGVSKWQRLDDLVAKYPNKAAELRNSINSGSDLTSNPDSEKKWAQGDEKTGLRVRIVDHWYQDGDDWRWCLYTGACDILDGVSPFKDEKGKTFCKYIPFSANVDQDGDRYGFHRNMKDAQTEINFRRSKGIHTLMSPGVLFLEQGSGIDVDATRREASRPDGVVEYPRGGQKPEFDKNAKGQELQGNALFLKEAKDEIENYGINPALVGQGVENMSGIAQRMQQQAGIAELGPYMIAFRGWKLRVYRAIWNAVRDHWKAQRWIRVTDDPELIQIFAVNQTKQADGSPVVHPETGQPAIANALGSLDVDIIIEEGPDTINMQQDMFDTLTVMARGGADIPVEMLIELAPIQSSVKKKLLDINEKKAQQTGQMQQAVAQAKLRETNASADLKMAQGQKAIADANAATQPQPQGDQGASVLDFAEKAASIRKTEAETHHIGAKTALDYANAGRAVADTHTSVALAKHTISQPKELPGDGL